MAKLAPNPRPTPAPNPLRQTHPEAKRYNTVVCSIRRPYTDPHLFPSRAASHNMPLAPYDADSGGSESEASTSDEAMSFVAHATFAL